MAADPTLFDPFYPQTPPLVSIPPGVQVPGVNNLYDSGAGNTAADFANLYQSEPNWRFYNGGPSAGAGAGGYQVPNSASAVGNLYSDAAGAAGGAAGGGSGILGDLAAVRAAAGEGGSLIQWPGIKGLIGKAGVPLAISQLMTAGINKLPSTGKVGDAREIAADAATGAGLGAAAGSIVPGPGTGLGLLAGGTAGALYGTFDDLFGSPNKPSDTPTFGKNDLQARRDELQSLMSQAGLPQSQQDAALRSFTVGWNIAPDDQTRATAYQGMQKQVLQAASQPTSQALTPEQVLATQVLATQTMQPYADQIQRQGQMAADTYNQLAATATNPIMKSIATNMGSVRAEDATKLAAAYEQQALMLPAMNALTLANQYGQQAFAAATKPTSSGSSVYQQLLNAQQNGGLGNGSVG